MSKRSYVPQPVLDREESRKTMECERIEANPVVFSRNWTMAFIAAAAVLVLSLAMAAESRAAIGIESYSARLVDSTTEALATQAGGHPDLVTAFHLETAVDPVTGAITPSGSLKDVQVDLPPGVYGNPTLAHECSIPAFRGEDGLPECSTASQVGIAMVELRREPQFLYRAAVFNLTPQGDDIATFGFAVVGTGVRLGVTLRPDGDYAIRTNSLNTAQALPVFGVTVTLWGVPGDPVHDSLRYNEGFYGAPADGPELPFLTAPTRCDAALISSMRANSWQEPDQWVAATDEESAMTGCDKLVFKPGIQVTPEVPTAGAPSGYDVDVFVPQNPALTTPATPQLRMASVTLPEGVAMSPSAAQGLASCSDEEIAVGTDEEPTCTSASKIGSVSIETPLLRTPLQGDIILGDPKSGKLFRLWLVVRGSNVLLKIPGVAQPDPATGRITAVFDDTPQLPFSHLHLHFKGGSRAVLVNPDTCGTKTVSSEMVAWSGPTASPTASFDITGCLDGFSPGLEAGSENPLAGASSPFKLRITRNDGEQKLGSIDLTLPPGQLAKLKGIPYCPDASLAGISGEEGAAAAEAASPSCPAASEVGSVLAGAGAGATPFYVGGKVYLAGPYKGAPLSVAFVTPALAGPFDLGNVVVRSALKLNPVTAQVEAVSDPLPTILHGVPLDLKDVRVSLDRPEFTLNPTSCREMQVAGQVTSSTGTAADVANRYQVGDCASLGFRPRLKLSFTGATHRGGHPKLRSVLRMPAGDANIARAAVTLPHAAFLDQAHIRTICTRVQFAADACPKGSIYGRATAYSPLLGYALSGPVYLRSSDNPLPDAVARLRGPAEQPIEVDLAGRIDSVHGALRATFAQVPDAPISRFVLEMFGGKRGLIELSTDDYCAENHRVKAAFTGQNGRRSSLHPVLRNPSCTK